MEEPKKKRGFWGRIFGREDEERKRRKKNGRKKKSGGRPARVRLVDSPMTRHSCRFVTSSATGICSSSWPAPWRGNRLPPSLIFAGPDGVGKRAAAVALAQLVNCATPFERREGGCFASLYWTSTAQRIFR